MSELGESGFPDEADMMIRPVIGTDVFWNWSFLSEIVVGDVVLIQTIVGLRPFRQVSR